MECPFADNVSLVLDSVTSRTEMRRRGPRTSFPQSTKPGIVISIRIRDTVPMEIDASLFTVPAARREWTTERCCGVWGRRVKNSFVFWRSGRKTAGTVGVWASFSVWEKITGTATTASQWPRCKGLNRRRWGRTMSMFVRVAILFDFYTICQVYAYPITITFLELNSR